MQVEISDKKVTFGELSIGEVFFIPPFTNSYMKINNVYFKEDGNVVRHNAVCLNTGYSDCCSNKQEIILKHAKLVIDN